MIKKLRLEDVSQVASLHLTSFPNDTLSLFGKKFLTILYEQLFRLHDIHALGYFSNRELVGFVIGVEDSQTYLKRVILSRWFSFFIVFLPKIVQPKLLKRIFETFFYGQKSASSGAELISIAVSKTTQHRGIGTTLINSLSKSFAKIGIKRFHVSVYANNKIANYFYLKLGGKKIRSFYLYEKKWYIYDFYLIPKPRSFSVILPTYNESENIIPLIKEILKVSKKSKLTPEVLVVDDNSPDQTAAKVKSVFAKKHEVKVFIRTKDRGLARSIAYGIKKATKEYIVVMDTDFNHNPQVIPQLLEKLSEADLVIGSRFVLGGGMEDRPRHYLSFIFNVFIRFYLQLPTRDNLSGYFAANKKLLIPHLISRVFSGFGEYFVRLIFLLHKRRKRIVEVPVYYRVRHHGKRKSQFLNMLITYTKAVIALKHKF